MDPFTDVSWREVCVVIGLVLLAIGVPAFITMFLHMRKAHARRRYHDVPISLAIVILFTPCVGFVLTFMSILAPYVRK